MPSNNETSQQIIHVAKSTKNMCYFLFPPPLPALERKGAKNIWTNESIVVSDNFVSF